MNGILGYVKNFSNDLNFSSSRIIDPGFDNQIFDLKFMQGETTICLNIYLKKLKQKLNLTLKVGSSWACLKFWGWSCTQHMHSVRPQPQEQ